MWKLSNKEKPENDKFFGPKDIVLACTFKKDIVFATYDEEKEIWIDINTKKEIEVEYWDYITFPGKGLKSKELVEDNNNYRQTSTRNSMGCSENWYDPEWAICNTFSEDEILRMSDQEIDNLIKLGEAIGNGLY